MNRRGKRDLCVAYVIAVALSLASIGASAQTTGVEHRLRNEFPAVGSLVGMTTARPAAVERSAAATLGPIRGFAGRQFADGYRIETGNSHIVLRPELSRGSIASAGESGLAYKEAFPGVEAFRTGFGGVEAEIFVVDQPRDSGLIAYRVAAANGVAEIVNDGHAVRFVSGRGPDTFLSAPLTFDSTGRVSYDSGWEIDRSDRGAVATLRLRVRDHKLTYPIALVYAPGRLVLSSQQHRVIANFTGAVSGTVTEAGGGALSGAVVSLFDSAGEFVASATTDGSGNYSIGGLDTDRYRALASAANHVPQLYQNVDCPDFTCSLFDGTAISVTDGSSTPGINFALHSSVSSVATVNGNVTGPGSVALEAVTVVLYNTTGVAAASDSTDANGNFRITLEQGGTFFARTFNGVYAGLVDGLYQGLTCVACDPTTGTSFTATVGSSTNNINFALVNGGRISGKITDAFDSSPLAERQVAIYDSHGVLATTATSDDSGNYISFNGLVTGTYYAVASGGGFFSQLYKGTDCNLCVVTGGTPISVTLGATTPSIDFGLNSSQAIVTGKVTDAATSSPLGGVLVVFYNTAGQQVRGTTSDFATGSYTVFLPSAGKYFALTQNGLQQDYLNQLYNGIACSGCSPTTGTAIDVVLSVPTENVNFALTKAGGKITGSILDASTSNPVELAFVQVFSSAGLLAAFGFADSTGAYAVSDGLTTGDYFVIARAPSYSPVLYTNVPCGGGCSLTDGTPVHVTSGQTTANINFSLSSTTAFVTGHVFSFDTQAPLPNVLVAIYDSHGNQVSSAIAGSNGLYSAALATGGTYYARTIDTVDTLFHDQLWDHLTCEDCIATAGTPIHISDGGTAADINFDLHTFTCPTITLSPASLPNTTIGASYNQTITASGGVGASTFAVTSGSLPSGLVLGIDGSLTGSASASGTSMFTVTATDTKGCTGSAGYTISVSAAPTTTALSALPSAVTFGNPVTLTATVAPSTATGTVTFLDGLTSLTTIPLSGSTASTSITSLNAGTHQITATYNGSASFAPSTSAAVTVTVMKATPLIIWATPAAITYPAPLTATQLNATANVPGSFAYNPPAGTILNAGMQTLTTTFTPADTNNYNTATANVTLVVNKADQQIQWSNPADIVYSTPLGPTQLNATVTVPGPSPAGALVYTPPAGTILNAGTQTLSVTAQPTVNYNAATASVMINVTKATPAFSSLSAPVITVGTASAAITGTISFGVFIPTGSVIITIDGASQTAAIQADGTFSATFDTSGLTTGTYPIAFSYGGDSNFTSASGASTLTVTFGVTGGTLQQQPANAGSAIPFRIQLVDAMGSNVSSNDLVVTAYGVQLANTMTWLPAPSTGNNSQQFRFQNVNGGSYLFTLKTTGLASGKYVLGFTAAGDPAIHTVPFSIR